MSTLEIAYADLGTNHPGVRLLVDGQERLRTPEDDTRLGPDELVHSGALLPTDPRRRVAVYACSCGEVGCGNVAGLVTRVGDTVLWSDFRSVAGVYSGALPDEPEDGEEAVGPDPVADDDPDLPSRPVDLPDLTFDAAQYDAVVRAAMADRSWETRARAVVRLVCEQMPDTVLWPAREGDAVILTGSSGGRGFDATTAVPPGRATDVADALVALLREGVDVRQVAHTDLWARRVRSR